MNIIPKDVLNDLYIRFLQHIDDPTNIFSDIEAMYWFYLDQFLMKDNLPNIDLIDFTTQVFDSFPNVKPEMWETEYDAWKSRKSKTPTASAVIIDTEMTMVLMVKGFRSRRWMFPGGKKENESFAECAIREVDEEIGFDISSLIDKNLFIDVDSDGVHRRHYVINGVSLSTVFKPKTNHEIEKITWFPLRYLPVKRDDDCYEAIGEHTREFLSTMRVVRVVRRWTEILTDTKRIHIDRVAALRTAEESATNSNGGRRRRSTKSTNEEGVDNGQRILTRTNVANKDGFHFADIRFNEDQFVMEVQRHLRGRPA